MPIRNRYSRAQFVTLAIALVAIAWAFAPAVAFGGEAAPAAATTPEGIDYFERNVRPLFSQSCLECHGEKQQGGLRLDSRSTALAGGDSGPAIVAGDPQESLLSKSTGC